MTEKRKEEYRAYLVQHMEKADLAELEINSWLDQCDQFLQEHACTDRTLYELEAETLETILGSLHESELFHVLKRQKNGRLLRALERYTAYRTGGLDYTGKTNSDNSGGIHTAEKTRERAKATTGTFSDVRQDLSKGFPAEMLSAGSLDEKKTGTERSFHQRPAASRMSTSLTELLTEADPGNPDGIPDWRNEPAFPTRQQKQILERERKRRELEKTASDRGLVQEMLKKGDQTPVQAPVKGTESVYPESSGGAAGAVVTVPAGTQQLSEDAGTEDSHFSDSVDEQTSSEPAEIINTKEIEKTAEEESPKDDHLEEGFSSDKASGQKESKKVLSPLDDPDFVPRSMKILIGQTIGEEPLRDYYWEPNNTSRVFHMNTGIIGTMGTGKTQFTKSLIAQLMQNAEDNFDGTEPGLLIFDYKGDYNESKRDFVDAVRAKVLKPYRLPFNPFSIAETRTFRPLLPTHTANAFKDILARVYRLGPKQQSSLFRCIMSAYESRGVVSARPETWKKMPPTFSDVYEIYEKDETIPKNDSLAAAMNKLQMFELFERESDRIGTLFDLLHGTVVVDLSGYDPDIQSLVVAIMLQLFYTQMVASGSSMLRDNLRQITRMVLVDEADNFMSEDFPALKKILKEGREFGVGVVLSTQSLKHFQTEDNSYADYIMTWVVHNVVDLKDKDVDFVFRVPARSQEEMELLRRVRELEKFQSIVKVGNEDPVCVRDLAFWELLEGKGKRAETPEDEESDTAGKPNGDNPDTQRPADADAPDQEPAADNTDK